MKTKHVLNVYLLSQSKEDLQNIAKAVSDADSLFLNPIVTNGAGVTLDTDKMDLWGEVFDTMPPDLVIIGGVANNVVVVNTEPDKYYYGLSIMSVFDSENLHFGVNADTTIESVPCMCTFIGAEMWQRLLDRPGMQSISVFGSAYTADLNVDKWKNFDYQFYGSTDNPDNLETLSIVGKFTPQDDTAAIPDIPFGITEMKDEPWVFFPLLPGEGKALAGIAMWQTYVDWKLGGADTPQLDIDTFTQALEEAPATVTVTDAIEALMDGVAAAINEGTANFTEENGNITITLDGPVGEAVNNLINGFEELQAAEIPVVAEEEVIEYEPITWQDDSPWLATIGMGSNYIRCGVLMANGSSCTNVGTSIPGMWKSGTHISRFCNRHSAMTMAPLPKMKHKKKDEEEEVKENEVAALDVAAQALETVTTALGMAAADPDVVPIQHPFHLDNAIHTTPANWANFTFTAATTTTTTFATNAPPVMPTWVPEATVDDDDIPVGPDPWGQVYDKLSDELTDLLVSAISQADNGGALDTDLLVLTQSTIDILKPLLLAADQAKGAEVLFVMTTVMMNLDAEVDA